MRGTLQSPLQIGFHGGDHPRVCGEHDVGRESVKISVGSSPRMQGTRGYGLSLLHLGGIIPAYAGNTQPVSPCRQCNRDHPRVCGEHLFGACRATYVQGSSPRMRGTPAREAAPRRLWRIIPAYAGNTRKGEGRAQALRDHPRVCGEHPSYMSRGRYEVGSSPRMRGTLTILSRPNDLIGIIPAYAGNTERHYQRRVAGRDHPRVCGEHWCFWNPRIALWGSSPRMRGTHLLHLLPFPEEGIIPAYAGNTSTPSETPLAHRDHPRVCGEHFNAVRNAASPQGSSPRMRGTPTILPGRHRGHGIIPAYAGNTVTLSAMHEAYWDHPRVCGEHHFSINTPS